MHPFILLLFFDGVGYIYKGFYKPIVRRVKKVYLGWKAEFYVALIVFVRTLSYCAGLMVGHYEYKRIPTYKKNLESYLTEKFKIQNTTSDIIR